MVKSMGAVSIRKYLSKFKNCIRIPYRIWSLVAEVWSVFLSVVAGVGGAGCYGVFLLLRPFD